MTTRPFTIRQRTEVPVYVFVHGDLDGWMCALLSIIAYGWDTVIKYCNYNDVAGVINKFLDSVKGMKTKPFVLIADITPPKEVCERINSMAKKGMFASDPDGNGVVLIDHHDTVDWLDDYEWAVLDTSLCGSKLLFDRMIQNQDIRKQFGKNVSEYGALVGAVDAHDRWQDKSPLWQRAEGLTLLSKFIGKQEFLKAFHDDPEADLDRKFGPTVVYLKKAMDDYVTGVIYKQAKQENMHKDKAGNTYALLIADRNSSELGNTLLKQFKDVDYVVIINSSYSKCELRARESGKVHVGEIAKEAVEKGGGGHKAAAGFETPSIRDGLIKTVTAILAQKKEDLDVTTQEGFEECFWISWQENSGRSDAEMEKLKEETGLVCVPCTCQGDHVIGCKGWSMETSPEKISELMGK